MIKGLVRLTNIAKENQEFHRSISVVFGLATVFADITVQIPAVARAVLVILMFLPILSVILFENSDWLKSRAAKYCYNKISSNRNLRKQLYWDYGQRGLTEEDVSQFVGEEFPTMEQEQIVSRLNELLNNEPLRPNNDQR